MGNIFKWLKQVALGKARINRFLLFFLIVAFIASATAGYYAYTCTRNRTNNQLTQHFQDETNLASTYIEESISACYNDVQYLALNPTIASTNTTLSEKLSELQKAQYLHSTFDNVTLLNTDGLPLASTRYLATSDWNGQEVFKEALTGHGSMSDAQLSLLDPNQVVIIVAAPVFNPDPSQHSNVTSVITAQINMEKVWQIMNGLKIGDTGYTAIVNKLGQYIFHPQNTAMLFEPMTGKEVSNKVNSLFSYRERYPGSAHGDRRTGLLSPTISSPSAIDKGWQVLVSQKSSEAYANLNGIKWVIFGGFVLGWGFILVISVLVSPWLSRRLRLLAQEIQRNASGNSSDSLAIRHHDEVSNLTRSYNELASKLEQREEEREYLQLLKRSMAVLPTISSTLSKEKFLSNLLSAVLNAFECNHVWLFWIEEEHLVIHSFISREPEANRDIEIVLGKDISKISYNTKSDFNIFTRAYNSKRLVFFEGESSTEKSIIRGLLGGKSGTIAALPLVIEEECVAVLVTAQTTPLRPGTKEIMFAVAQYSAIALENALLYETEHSQHQEKSHLYNLASAMSTSLDLHEVLDRALDGIMSLLPSPEEARSIISSYDEQTSTYTILARRSSPEVTNPINSLTLDEETKQQLAPLFNGEVLMVQDINSLSMEQRFPAQIAQLTKHVAVKSMLVIPLIARGRYIGSLYLGNRLPVLPSEHQLEALRYLANNIAVAIENASLYAKERERSAELQSLTQLKTDFMLALSHELKTPLTSLIVSTGLLKEESNPGSNTVIDRLVSGIVRSAEKLNKLVSDLLEAARLESSVVELKWEYVDIVPRMKTFITTFMPLMESKGQQFAMTLPSNGLWIWTDAQRLEQMLTNLLSNAYKFTPEGGQIQFDIKEQETTFIMKVSDTGPGIPDDEQKKIFEPFYRARGASKYTGSGLGLSIARRLVELLGGTISVQSQIGHGATFTVILPKGDGKEGKAKTK